jgi:hypothetical protein
MHHATGLGISGPRSQILEEMHYAVSTIWVLTALFRTPIASLRRANLRPAREASPVFHGRQRFRNPDEGKEFIPGLYKNQDFYKLLDG